MARCTLARLMHELGLQKAIGGRSVKAIVSNKAGHCPQDQVNLQFNAPRPTMLWFPDFYECFDMEQL